MLLLALDTATPAVTVALHDVDDVLAHVDHVRGQLDGQPPPAAPGAPNHGELLIPSIDQVLREADKTRAELTHIVVGTGPGPYTGLRVGLATAEAFGAALGLPVHGLCTLDGLAYATDLDKPFVVATDARRKEVYWARYADARTRLGEPAVDRPADIAEHVADVTAAGAGAQLYADTFTGARTDLPTHQSAAALARLAVEKLASGTSVSGDISGSGSSSSPGDGFLPVRPLYLRRPDAKVPANYKVVTPQ